MSSSLKNGKSERVLSIAAQTLQDQKSYNEMMRNLAIFGTSHPHIYKKAPLWVRFKWRVLDYRDRVRDAWLVLTGKAEIYDGQDD